MVISIFIARKFAAYLGLAVKLKSLSICASCALVIAIIFPLIPTILTQYNLFFMLCIALTAAIFITHYNEKLILTSNHRKRSAPPPGQNLQPVPETLIIPVCATKESELPTVTIPAAPSSRLKKINNHFWRKNTHIPISLIPVDKTDIKQLEPAIATITPHSNINNDQTSPTANLIIDKLVIPIIEPMAVTSFSTIETKLKKIGRTLKRKQPSLANELPDLSGLTTLDALLDYAEEQKRQHFYENAMFACKQALHLYENDDYAPFIAIEIGNFYKNTGLYDEAIVIYSRAYSLPSVVNNDELQQEFQKNIAYLRIVKTVLSKHNCPRMDFTEIPDNIMQEIENVFTLWHSQKHVS